MSRTKRRKKYGKDHNKHNYDPWIIQNYGITKFHSDKGVGDVWPVPAWFRRMKERELRSKNNQELKRIIRTADYEDYNFIPYCKTIQWEWW